MKHDRSKEHLLQVQGQFISHMGQLRAFVVTLMPDYSQVDDIVQEVFLTVTEKAAEFQSGTNFRAWLFTIARYRVFKAFNRMSKGYLPLSEELLDKLSHEMAESEAEQPYELEQRLSLLEQCIEKLAPQARRVVQMRYFDNLKAGAIAGRLKLSVNGVSVLLSRSRSQLRSCVEMLLAGGAGHV